MSEEWFVTFWLFSGSAGGRGAGWNKIEEPEEKKSIMCYKCNSANDPNCGDPFEPYTLGVVNCSLVPVPEHLDPNITATICRKTIQKGNIHYSILSFVLAGFNCFFYFFDIYWVKIAHKKWQRKSRIFQGKKICKIDFVMILY